MDKSTLPLNTEVLEITTRTLLAQSRVEYLERYMRLVKHGLTLREENTRWYNLTRRMTNWFYRKSFYRGSIPRIEKLIKQYRLSMSAPFAQPFNQAELMFKEFCKDYKVSIDAFNHKQNTDMMEM